jgi:hypothetical protein
VRISTHRRPCLAIIHLSMLLVVRLCWPEYAYSFSLLRSSDVEEGAQSCHVECGCRIERYFDTKGPVLPNRPQCGRNRKIACIRPSDGDTLNLQDSRKRASDVNVFVSYVVTLWSGLAWGRELNRAVAHPHWNLFPCSSLRHLRNVTTGSTVAVLRIRKVPVGTVVAPHPFNEHDFETFCLPDNAEIVFLCLQKVLYLKPKRVETL